MKWESIMNLRRLLIIGLLLLSGLALIGCSGDGETADGAKSPSGQETEKDTLNIVTSEVPYFLDPTQKQSGTYLRSVGAVEALTKITEEGEIVPELAKSISQTDENNWKIELQNDVIFWSGKVLDEEEVIKSMVRYRENSPDGESLLQGITFTKGGELEVIATTEKQNVNIPLILTSAYIMNADKDFTTIEETDLTGMYKITEYIPKEKISLEKFDDYWGQKPEIKYIKWEEMPDPDARKIAAQNGDADIIRALEPPQVADLEASGNVNVYKITPSGTLSVYMNLQRPPYDDKNVRQALNWSLDRDALSLFATEGFSEPSTTWLGSNPQFQDERNLIYSQNIKKAEELMKESGWEKNSNGLLEKDGKTMKFTLHTFGRDKLLGEAVQSQWMNLGVDVDLRHGDYSLIEAARETGEWDGLIETWTNFGDPYPIAYTHFGVDGSCNYGKYDNDLVNEALQELEKTGDADRQHELLSTINKQVAEDSNLISLMPRPVVVAVNKNVKGFIPHFMSFEYSVNPDLSFEK